VAHVELGQEHRPSLPSLRKKKKPQAASGRPAVSPLQNGSDSAEELAHQRKTPEAAAEAAAEEAANRAVVYNIFEQSFVFGGVVIR
jgi:hypothetical protein